MARRTTTRRLTDAEILAQIPAARARAARARHAGLRTLAAAYDAGSRRLMLELSNGFLLGVPVAALPDLADATPAQLAAVTVSPEGAAIHFDALDADYSVAGLVISTLGADEARRELARMAGRVTSRAKAAAARENGAKGGRPRRSTKR
jgi:hypothetical protein